MRQGFAAQVFEQGRAIGEIGASMPLDPHAFRAFDALGTGDKACDHAVSNERTSMHDARDEPQVGQITTSEAFRQRLGHRCAVMHRADSHGSRLEGAVALGEALRVTNTDWDAALQRHPKNRVTRAVHSGREMGRRHHAAGVERLIGNSLREGPFAKAFLRSHRMDSQPERQPWPEHLTHPRRCAPPLKRQPQRPGQAVSAGLTGHDTATWRPPT